jgi:exodeoxyribonuclease VII, large subunit
VNRIKERLSKARYDLDSMMRYAIPTLVGCLSNEQHRIDMLAQRAQLMDPKLLLSRGYSITLHNGKAVRHASQLKAGDVITTRFEQGEVESVVKK